MTVKFRAWDEDKKMFTYYNFLITADVNKFGGGKWDLEDLSQFTGLKDKKGKEVWEGDIVGVPYVNPMGGVDNDYDPEKVFPVIFEHGEFALKRPEFNQPLSDWLKKETGEYIPNFGDRKIITDKFAGEVIGNIYENKGLLK